MKKFLTFILSLAMVLMVFPNNLAKGNSEITYEKTSVLAGKTISVMGDSISTYAGFSDAMPITSEEHKYRYGEPYYGEEGDDVHVTTFSRDDTWWQQAANALGAEMLVGNAANSSGLLRDSYPGNEDWENYLKDMLMYKSRPYYLGKDGKSPDIIALYVGSADVASSPIADFGSIDAIDWDTLIIDNGDGTYTYATPTTVAEAYSILLHKIQVTYPNAEVYCFTVVPNAGGDLSSCNKRIKAAYPFNEMVKGVANYYGAHIVDLFEEFALDPDKDGIATEEDFATFKSYYHNDPHPNDLGFDVITKCFVESVLENSKYIARVETSAGSNEYVLVDSETDGVAVYKKAKNYITDKGYLVNYSSTSSKDTYKEKYTSEKDTYVANGGKESYVVKDVNGVSLLIPVVDEDDANTEVDETENTASGRVEGTYDESGDFKADSLDGIYDYYETNVKEQAKVWVDTTKMVVTDKSTHGTIEGMECLSSDTIPTDTNNLITDVTPVVLPESKEDVPQMTDGYEYIYIGSDKYSEFLAAFGYGHKNPGFTAEEPVYKDDKNEIYVHAKHSVFEKRNLIVPRIYVDNVCHEGKFPARWSDIQQFTLASKDGGIVTTYCADQVTPAEIGYSYNVQNLEDAHYYTEDAAKMIRMIGRHAYWGTSSGLGSLSALKENMLSTGKYSEEELSGLTDGIAMTATQYAIWTFSNEMDGVRFVNAYVKESMKQYDPTNAAEKAQSDLIFKVYDYLVNLDPSIIEQEQNIYNTIINEKNYISDLQLTINEKDKEHANNKDTDETNDVYKTDLAIKLAVKTGRNADDKLALKILDEDNNVIAIGRIMGELQDGEVQLELDGNGNYTFRNIPLEEGEQSINVVLEGHQYLDKDVYLFSSEIIDDTPSQTMVGVAEGLRNVNVEMALEFSMRVEDEVSVVNHVWRNEKIKEDNNSDLPPKDDDKKPEGGSGELDESKGPDTGDVTNIAGLMSMMILSLGVIVTRRKKA